MNRLFQVAAALLVLASTGPALAGDAMPAMYVATKVNQGGNTAVVLLPRPLDRFDPSRVGDAVLAAFDALRAAHGYEYGRATVLLDGDAAHQPRVTLNLDPDRREFHDLVASEVYHTVRSLGVVDVRAPVLREGPLDDFALRAPVYLLRVPFYDALPPRGYPHAMIALSPVEVMQSDLFYQRLKQGDKDLTDRVLAGLGQSSDSVKLAVLAAFPHLQVADRAGRLLPLLSDQSAAIRLAVLKLLESQNTKDVNDRLTKFAEGEQDTAVKLAAVRLLSARGIKKFDIFIDLEKLSDPSDEVVVQTIDRLAASKTPAVAPALVQSLHHRSGAVREAARKGLLSLGVPEVLSAGVADDSLDGVTREAFARNLAEGDGQFQGKALAYLIASGTEASATWAVARIGEKRPADGVRTLYLGLERREPGVRAAAARAVGAYRSPETLQPLLGSAKTQEDRAVVEEVATGIIAAQPLDTVLSLMEDRDVTTRRLAMKALGDSLKGAAPPARAVTVLQARLADPDLGVRRAAVYTLARVPDERVTASVMDRFGDTDAEIREAAVVAAVRSSDPRAADILVKALSDESDKVKSAALDGIAAKRIKSAREQLQMMGHYQDVTVRRKAVKAYIAMLDPGEVSQYLDFLTEMLYDQDPEVKLAAIGVVKQVHERRAIVAIGALVIDPDRGVKTAALDALAASKERDALEGIEKAVFDNDHATRVAALDALQRLGRKEALDFLSELLKLEQDPEIRAKAEQVQKALLAQ